MPFASSFCFQDVAPSIIPLVVHPADFECRPRCIELGVSFGEGRLLDYKRYSEATLVGFCSGLGPCRHYLLLCHSLGSARLSMDRRNTALAWRHQDLL